MPEPRPADSSDDAPPLNPHTHLYDYNPGGLLLYEGRAVPGMATSAPVWSIRRYTWGGTNLVKSDWADGNSLFDNVWDKRADLVYA